MSFVFGVKEQRGSAARFHSPRTLIVNQSRIQYDLAVADESRMT
jgi:hypothetical protein